MTKKRLRNLYIFAVLSKQRRVGMSKLVKPSPFRYFGFLHSVLTAPFQRPAG